MKKMTLKFFYIACRLKDEHNGIQNLVSSFLNILNIDKENTLQVRFDHQNRI